MQILRIFKDLRMKLPFREFHLTQLFSQYQEKKLPLDLLVHQYFKAHPALGSKDRAFLSDAIFALTKWQGLLTHLNIQDPLQGIIFLDSDAFRTATQNPEIPPHIRSSCPETLFNLLTEAYGEPAALDLALTFNTKAPVTIRTNTLKIDREELLKRLSPAYEVEPTRQSPTGIEFKGKVHFSSLPEYISGLFEVQDEGSQLVAELMQVEPGQLALDYCAGAGGKALAFAPRMNNKGQIFLHDIRGNALGEAKKRLARAGIQNAQASPADDPKWKKWKKKMDWILVDAPCSGTGTLRRKPDMKWNFTEEQLKHLVGQQRVIFEKALSFLKPGGKIVYATCSILPQENEKQIEHFMKTYSLKLVGEPLKILPQTGLMDGFYAAVLAAN
jgi:16S rRNA C967 or C1407 C5-methylase (RsmB/RsmF family)